MYIKHDGSQIIQFPYTVADLKTDNASVSFPRKITEEVLARYGVSRIHVLDPAEHDETTHYATLNDAPTFENNQWVLGWNIVAKSQEQIDEEWSNKCASVRNARNELLKQSDWTQMPDVTLTESQSTAWRTYRQALRDVPSQAGFPNSVEWPNVVAVQDP